MIKVVPRIFKQCLAPFSMLTVEGPSETGLFRYLSKHLFCTPYFQKYISYQGHLFLQNVQTLMQIPEVEQKIDKKVFVFQIIAFELGATNSNYYAENNVASGVHVFTNRTKISHITNRNFFRVILPRVMKNYDKSAALQISQVIQML